MLISPHGISSLKSPASRSLRALSKPGVEVLANRLLMTSTVDQGTLDGGSTVNGLNDTGRVVGSSRNQNASPRAWFNKRH
jgi:hypothetical protein